MAMGGVSKELIGVLVVGFVLVILGQIVPFYGGTMEDATPTLAADSQWNATYNTDLPQTADTWGDIVTIVGAAIMLIAIMIAIKPVLGNSLQNMFK